jgi:NADH-quinone oxidoreductase subunit L
MTAFYMFRLIYMTFHGESRVDPKVLPHVHESPKTMTIPLIVLAAGSILAGWVGTPIVFGPIHDALPSLEHFLSPSIASAEGHGAAAEGHGGAAAEEHHDTSMEWLLMACSVGFAIGGIFLAKKLFARKTEGDVMESLPLGLHPVLMNKYYVDELYNAAFVDGFAKGGGTALWKFDGAVIDGAVNGAGWLTRFTSRAGIWGDTWIVDGLVRLTGFCVKFASYPVRMLQTGLVQNYALFVVLGALSLLGYFIFQ